MLDVVRTVCDQRASYADVGPVFRHWLETLPWYRLELIEGPGGGPIAVADESPVWGLGAPGSDVVPFPRVELDVDQRKAHNVTCAETRQHRPDDHDVTHAEDTVQVDPLCQRPVGVEFQSIVEIRFIVALFVHGPQPTVQLYELDLLSPRHRFHAAWHQGERMRLALRRED